jgi:hypothetical protein
VCEKGAFKKNEKEDPLPRVVKCAMQSFSSFLLLPNRFNCLLVSPLSSLPSTLQVANTALLLLEVQGEPLYDKSLAITSAFVCIYAVEFVLLVLVRGWAW